MAIRKPAVADRFYPGERESLRRQIALLWPRPAPPRSRALGAMVPHAGYVYSGGVAAAVYSRLEPADVYVLVGPNHSGRGPAVALSQADAWETPLGRVPLHPALGRAIMDACPEIRPDDAAHQREHCLEVQLPFLQWLEHPFAIVPLLVNSAEVGLSRRLGAAVAQAVKSRGERCLILASSDMNHFENQTQTRQLDRQAIAQTLARDPEQLIATVRREGISMCGAWPTAAVVEAVNILGAGRAELAAYATSGDVSGETDSVVGYAGIIFQ